MFVKYSLAKSAILVAGGVIVYNYERNLPSDQSLVLIEQVVPDKINNEFLIPSCVKLSSDVAGILVCR